MSDERDTTRHGAHAADDGDGTAAAQRPSGKRSARRGRAGSSDAETGAVATIDRPMRKASTTSGRAGRERSRNPFKRLIKFLREVIAELRKVIWPNRKQMITYTSVVLVFVVFMVAFISGLDLAFIKGVSWLFG
ncbi:preprotein translocase subunit SecE [Nocardia donostiensis]|uniref:Protein translocase subunit SecE n=1 Tax=Nocardia donostiensis TaxID=1538463 RepID=A0A1V2TCT2_9NOCA|nr:preprotein translocase subunit SecE [Nocardia donostiensis]ONM47141.1 preprotein translocase subunit SecE [Nocardia donostiensis]OQS15188.1 preprotein translocase subunit SecE [Nocardia donostiensis]OQS20126.1 preprotein translocase subunit SecE [Nocardia donostiensis]